MELKLSEGKLFFGNSATNNLPTYTFNEQNHTCIRTTKPANGELHTRSEMFIILNGINNLHSDNNLTEPVYSDKGLKVYASI